MFLFKFVSKNVSTLKNKKANSTLRASRAVPHPSTDRALRRLTLEVRRDPVYSTRYGRQQFEYLHCMTLAKNLAKSNSTGVGAAREALRALSAFTY